MIAVYIPIYNNEEWCKNFTPTEGYNYIVSDNASTDNSVKILESKGLTVVKQPVNLGRIGNWEFCINHFIKTDYQWMKWLFVGDELYPNAITDLEEAIALYPDAAMIIAEFDMIISEEETIHWTMFEETKLLQPAESLKKASTVNWFGSPISTLINKKCLLPGLTRFSDMDWAADMLFCLNISAQFPVLYLNKNIGAFNAASRAYFNVNRHSPFSWMEDAIAFNKALKMYFNLTKDKEYFDSQSKEIVRELKNKISPPVMPPPPPKESLLVRFIKKIEKVILPKS